MASQEQFRFPFVDDYNVPESSFARTGFDKLPTPDQVRLKSLNYERRHRGLSKAFMRPAVLFYKDLGLAVKFGHHVSISEAHCLLFLRKHSPEVPVPEVYAWRRDRRQTFIYMELIHGSPAHIHGINMDELGPMLEALQRVPQTLVSPTPFIGHVNGRPLRSWRFIHSATPTAGPFSSVTEFHDWLATDYGRSRTMSTELCLFESGKTTTATDAVYRAKLDDNVRVVLTHGQLSPANILVGYPDGHMHGNPQIMAIIDWSMAGWMPLHWEDCEKECDEKCQSSIAVKAEDGTKVKNEDDGMADRVAEKEYRDAVRYFTLGAAP